MALATQAKFREPDLFHRDLKLRVQKYFDDTGHAQRDLPWMYVKTAVILAWFALSYAYLVFGATGVWTGLAGCVSLGLAMAGIGFSIQHDANHGGYSEKKSVNQALALTLDMLGGSSYVWSWKHNIFHHSHPNVLGMDLDIDMGPFGRMAPGQRRRVGHRFQHFYLWVLYGVLAAKWHFVDDFKEVLNGRVGLQKLPRPRGMRLAAFIAGKLVFLGWAFVLPAVFHPLWAVALGYALTSFVLGFTLACAFQLAHCVEDADFSEVPKGNATFEREWAVHQVESTVDFAKGNRAVTWYLGGLNFQVEHHLFPRICHLHYPALAGIVEATCRDHGVHYRSSGTLRSALGSHWRWLRKMGQPLPLESQA